MSTTVPPRRVEARRRLVEEEDLGIADERAGEREALPLAPRELAHPRRPLLLELDLVEQRLQRPGLLVEAAKELQGLLDGLLVRELRLLERDADPLAQRRVVLVPGEAEELDDAGGRLGQTLEDLDGRRLARAVRPEQPEAFARRDAQVDPVDGNDVLARPRAQATAARVHLAQLATDHGVHGAVI